MASTPSINRQSHSRRFVSGLTVLGAWRASDRLRLPAWPVLAVLVYALRPIPPILRDKRWGCFLPCLPRVSSEAQSNGSLLVPDQSQVWACRSFNFDSKFA